MVASSIVNRSYAEVLLCHSQSQQHALSVPRQIAKHEEAAVLQVWDLRKFKTPVHVWEDLPAMHPTTQVVFSPDERLIVTGVSAGRDGTGGALLFFDAQSRSLVRRIGMPSSVVAIQWQAKLNQIFVGVGMPLRLPPTDL